MTPQQRTNEIFAQDNLDTQSLQDYVMVAILEQLNRMGNILEAIHKTLENL